MRKLVGKLKIKQTCKEKRVTLPDSSILMEKSFQARLNCQSAEATSRKRTEPYEASSEPVGVHFHRVATVGSSWSHRRSGANGRAGDARGTRTSGAWEPSRARWVQQASRRMKTSVVRPLPKCSGLAGGRRRIQDPEGLSRNGFWGSHRFLWPENSSARMLGGTFSKWIQNPRVLGPLWGLKGTFPEAGTVLVLSPPT